MAYYWAHNGYRVMTMQDLQTVLNEREKQMGNQPDTQPKVKSMVVVYDPPQYQTEEH